jgi:hypothetical protein
MKMNMSRAVPAVTVALCAAAALAARASQPVAGARFEVSFPAHAHAEPITGMVYVAISRENGRTPIDQTGTTFSPLFST